MIRRPSLLLRLTRALVGLVTVWCLGCYGYEPILNAMRGTSAVAGMDCEAMMVSAVSSGSSTAIATGSGPSSRSTVSVAPTQSGFDCGCGGFCHAVSLTYPSLANAPLPVPLVVRDQPAEPASVVRSPLLPPPQRAA